jgi:hypothetical protein
MDDLGADEEIIRQVRAVLGEFLELLDWNV